MEKDAGLLQNRASLIRTFPPRVPPEAAREDASTVLRAILLMARLREISLFRPEDIIDRLPFPTISTSPEAPAG